VAILGALGGVALQLAAGGSSSESPVRVTTTDHESASAQVAAPVSREASGTAPVALAAPVTRDPTGGTPVETATTDLVAPAAQPANAPVAAPAEPTGIRLRIPALGIDARVVTLGFNPDGELDVPGDGASVGWYEISARPGEPGNALLGAHFDWDGSLAVFSRLNQLSEGDRVFLDNGAANELVYEVSVATSVGWDHPVADVLASTGLESSLTLFTCGGAFDGARSEYDERLIVRAVQVEPSAPLTAHR